jgi:hypothetical protein
MTYRYCSDCNNKYKSFEDCPECGLPLYHLNGGNNQQTIKDSNQTVQVGGNNSGDIFIQNKEEPLTLIQRDSIKPITVGNTPVKTWWLPVIGLATAGLGLTIEMFKLITTFKSLTNGGLSSVNSSSPLASLATLGLFAVLFITGAFFIRQFVLLKRRWHAGLPGNTLLERSHDGSLYTTKISGICGQCKGNVTVDTFGQSSRVSCANNSAHNVGFDWTVLGDVADDYKQRQQMSQH